MLKKLKYLLEFNDYSHYEDEYSDNIQTFKPKKRAKTHRAKKIKDSKKVDKRISKYSKESLIKRYSLDNDINWSIRWNHTDKHDILDRIVNRTEHDVPFINDKVKFILNYIEDKFNFFKTASYVFTFRKSKCKLVVKINKKRRHIYIGTILSYDMKSFSDVKDEVMLNESLNINNLIKEVIFIQD